MDIAESSLLGLERFEVLLTSPKAVRFAAAFNPPACKEDRAGLDLFRWWSVFCIPIVGTITFSSA